MRVKKRDGSFEDMKFEKITQRIRLCAAMEPALDPMVDPDEVAQKVVSGLADKISTVELDELAANVAHNMRLIHPDYESLAGRICVSSLHKQTKATFSEAMEDLYAFMDPNTEEHAPRISKEVIEIVRAHRDFFDSAIQTKWDFNFDYFGIVTLRNAYLLCLGKDKTTDTPIYSERPGYMYMRVAIGIHGGADLDLVLETYQLLAQQMLSHATPTMYNAGTSFPQMSSCFLTQVDDDSIEGIYRTISRCAVISKFAGGIGCSMHNVRANGSYIRSSGGHSTGLVPMLQNFQSTARYVDQGGGKRKGSFAMYLEPWHADILDVLNCLNAQGDEQKITPDLQYAMWVPDLFFDRLQKKGMWTLFCPNEAKKLNLTWGDEFEKLYVQYESDSKKVRGQIPAAELWRLMMSKALTRGRLYVLAKDACNGKSNQMNLGTIQGSNLCTEIVQYFSEKETAVCNLSAVNLSKCVQYKAEDDDGVSLGSGFSFDFERLAYLTRVATRNLNNVVDRNFYPIPEAEYSNLRHRPIGVGVMGLADAFAMLGIPYESVDARVLNQKIFQTMYYASLDMSCTLAEKTGLTYASFEGSPMQKDGKLQFDLWADEDRRKGRDPGLLLPVDKMWPWSQLRERIRRFGVRNSLLLAPMPTASTSQIAGCAEAFDPFTSNMFVRKTKSGNFIVTNRHLVRDLQRRHLWTREMAEAIKAAHGSIKDIAEIPDDVKRVYKTVWEVSNRALIRLAADRGRYICQSQSMSLYFDRDENNANGLKWCASILYAHSLGLKTLVYYTHSRAATEAVQFTVDKKLTSTAAATAPPAAVTAPTTAPTVEGNSMDVKNGGVDGDGEEDENVCYSCGV